MPLTRGANFGIYRIIGRLGRGGMATVFRAFEPGLDREVALKVLPAELLTRADFSRRFSREAKILARLEHRHIIPLYAFGIDEGLPWMAMRLVSGGTLSSLAKRPHPDRSVSVELLAQIAAALDYARLEGVLHRDVKPQNVLVEQWQHVYLSDFGIAKLVEGTGPRTRTGLVAGTPQYMAPEQALGRKVDHRADTYSLGVVAYEVLAGHPPFTGDTAIAVLMQHVNDPVPLPSENVVPAPAMRVIEKCLAKDPGERWESAPVFVRALEQALSAHTEESLSRASAAQNPSEAASPQEALPSVVAGAKGEEPEGSPTLAVGPARRDDVTEHNEAASPSFQIVRGTKPREAPKTDKRDIVIWLVLGLSAMALLLAVASYDPNDHMPLLGSRRTDVEPEPLRNLIGMPGALLGALLVRLFGVGALLVPLSIEAAAWVRFWYGGTRLYRCLLWAGLPLAASLAALAELRIGTVKLVGIPVDAGGVLGSAMANLLGDFLGTSGASSLMVASVVALAAVLLRSARRTETATPPHIPALRRVRVKGEKPDGQT